MVGAIGVYVLFGRSFSTDSHPKEGITAPLDNSKADAKLLEPTSLRSAPLDCPD